MLEVLGLTKSFLQGGVRAAVIRDTAFTVAKGEFFVLLGSSGCGKTTTLRAIAGLERPDLGSISIGGQIMSCPDLRIWVPPERRPTAMVFQSYAVWPHMNVHENIAFPLRSGAHRVPRREVASRVAEALNLLGLSAMATRPVTTLSGGQQQRVALARALALRPKVLLMDEPLSNLDLALQVRLRGEITRIVRQLGLTAVYVTHNQAEAMEMGDRIAVMDQGRIVQLDTPEEIYARPQHEFVARFIGEMTLVPARWAGQIGDMAVLDTALGRMYACLPAMGKLPVGASCLLGLRAEDIAFAPATDDAPRNLMEARIVARRFRGDTMLHTALCGETMLAFRTHRSVALEEGQSIRLSVDPAHCCTIPLAEVPSSDADGAEIDEPDMATCVAR
jgi:ABC-type Fe3+/spermidine/putrescine transport system ATPase subunit